MPRTWTTAFLILGGLNAVTGCEQLVGIHEVCKGADTDEDGSPDCMDECPIDPEKTKAGMCGCGIGDVDTDRDGFIDCVDQCPKDPTRTVAAGKCGCGVLDDQPLCLVHRYSFDEGEGATKFADSVGGAPATAAENPPRLDTGALVFSGGEYVTLPSTALSSLGDEVTIELWASWGGSSQWARIFDFGNNSADNPGQPGPIGIHYLFMTPLDHRGGLRAVFSNGGPRGEKVANGAATPAADGNERQHLAVVISHVKDTIAIYRNGRPEGSGPLDDMRLSFLKDVNNWLGRSQFAADPPFKGSISELRIYSAARTAEQLRAAAAAGADALPAQ